MTRIQKVTGIAVFAFMLCGLVVTLQVTTRLERPEAASSPDTSAHSCRDMNGKSFEWQWSNVPFASTCDAKPDAK